MLRVLFLVLLVVLVALVERPVRAVSAPLVADMSQHMVAITTGFAGSQVFLFGAIEGEGDIVVVVRGPSRPQTVFRKSRVGGIWVNTARMNFARVPTFYAVNATRPLDQIAGPAVRRTHELGIDSLRLPLPRAMASENIAEEWRDAILRSKLHQGFYQRDIGPVTVLANRLFRTTIYLPADVPVGLYQAEVYLIRDGSVIAAQTTPLNVDKVGLEADLYVFAHDHPAFYGLVAVLLALFTGWLGHVLFRRN